MRCESIFTNNYGEGGEYPVAGALIYYLILCYKKSLYLTLLPRNGKLKKCLRCRYLVISHLVNMLPCQTMLIFQCLLPYKVVGDAS